MHSLDILTANGMYCGIPTIDLQALSSSFHVASFPEGYPLACSGRRVDHIGVLISGSVELRTKDRLGHSIPFEILGAGEFFGEMAALDDGFSLYDMESVTSLRALVQPRFTFLEHLKRHMALERNAYQLNARRLQKLCRALTGGDRPPAVEKGDRDQNHIMARVLCFIDENYQDPIALDDLCRIGNMSKFHFIRKFKEITGLSFKEYLNRKRVEEAKVLMTRDGLNISQACYAVGFGDLSYFGRVFRKIEGKSPSQFRRIRRGYSCP